MLRSPIFSVSFSDGYDASPSPRTFGCLKMVVIVVLSSSAVTPSGAGVMCPGMSSGSSTSRSTWM